MKKKKWKNRYGGYRLDHNKVKARLLTMLANRERLEKFKKENKPLTLEDIAVEFDTTRSTISNIYNKYFRI